MSLLDSLHVCMRGLPLVGGMVREALHGVVAAEGGHVSLPWTDMCAVGLHEIPAFPLLKQQHAVSVVLLFSSPATARAAATKAIKHTLEHMRGNPSTTATPIMSFALKTERFDPLDLFYPGDADHFEDRNLFVHPSEAALRGAITAAKKELVRDSKGELTLLLGNEEGMPILSIGYRLFRQKDFIEAGRQIALGSPHLVDEELGDQVATYNAWREATGNPLQVELPFKMPSSIPAIRIAFVEGRFGAEPPKSAVPSRVANEILLAVDHVVTKRIAHSSGAANVTALRTPPPLSPEAQYWLSLSTKDRMTRPTQSEFFLPQPFLRALAEKIPAATDSQGG